MSLLETGRAARDRGAAGDVVLEVEHLQVDFLTRRGPVQAVRDVSFTIARGETVGLVGESGSGKSVTAQALLGMIELPGRIVGGDVRWKGESLVQGPKAQQVIERVRGREIAMVFQDPMTSLDPVFTIGSQMGEILRQHGGLSRKAARARSVELLDMVGIANPAERVKQYPFEMSGGMRQRVLIAMALACQPELLVADEPTTALDVTIQAQILELLADLQKELHLAVLLITHDLGVVAGVCDRVAVMYAGKIVEDAGATSLYAEPAHPYSKGLLDSTPRLDVVIERLASIEGSPPDLRQPPVGCAYAQRCPIVIDRCRREQPTLDPVGLDTEGRTRVAACFRAGEHHVDG
jgi:oligopeptide/dipeptide ABC transporter ATP-binding protein